MPFRFVGGSVNGDEIAKIVDAAIRAHDAAHTGPLGIGWEASAIVFATLVGPVLSVLISLVFTWWNDTKGKLRERQLWVFRTLLATRGQEINVDHVRAINLTHLIQGMAGIRRRVSRKLLIVFMDWVSKPSIHPIMLSHTRHARQYDRAVPVSSHGPQENHCGL